MTAYVFHIGNRTREACSVDTSKYVSDVNKRTLA